MIASLTLWFASAWPRLALYGVLFLAISGFCAFELHAHDKRVIQDYQAKLALAAGPVIVKQNKVTVQIQTLYVERSANTAAVTAKVQKGVADYAKSHPTDVVDDDFVRLLNDSAAGAVPNAPSRAYGSLRAPGAGAAGHP